MFRYILKRVLIFLPTMLIISMVAFWLGKMAPGDPVEPHLPSSDFGLEITGEIYQQVYEQLGLNKPAFYINFTSAAYPDTLYKVPGRYHQQSLSKLIAQYGNWDRIQDYNTTLEHLNESFDDLPSSVERDKKIAIRRPVKLLLEEYRDPVIQSHLQTLEEVVLESGDSILLAGLGDRLNTLIVQYNAIKSNPTKSKLYLPALRWQGFDNQYHNWLSAFLKGDFGLSYRNSQPVADKLRTPIFWTLIMNFLAIIIVYLLAVPLGVFSATTKSSFKDKTVTTILFILYSLPTFWIGTMLLVFFTNPEYGMDWFEGAGLGDLPSTAPYWDRFWETARHLILPVICLTYGSLAFMSRQVRGGMLNVLEQDYIRTARAKGLNKKKVIWKHAFRNALFPLITLFALVFPAAVTGSVVIETIFNIPGMGKEVIDSILAQDWPVLYTILMLVALLTMLGNLIADILYAFVDPRVKFK